MSPSADSALRTLAAPLLGEIAPEVRSRYRQSSVQVVAIATLIIATEYERAADVRTWENAAIREILRRHAGLVADPTRRARLEDAAASVDADLLISTLDAANADLERALIDLHAEIEGIEGPAARDAEREVWTYLLESARRRSVRLG